MSKMPGLLVWGNRVLEEEAEEKLHMAWGDVWLWDEEWPMNTCPLTCCEAADQASALHGFQSPHLHNGHNYIPSTQSMLMNEGGSEAIRKQIWLKRRRRSRSELLGMTWLGPLQAQPGAASLEVLRAVRQVASSEIRTMGGWGPLCSALWWPAICVTGPFLFICISTHG